MCGKPLGKLQFAITDGVIAVGAEIVAEMLLIL